MALPIWFIQKMADFGLGMAGNTADAFLGQMFYNARNKHLTGKEQEQNAFNAQQAQLNRDFQEEMSDTANQRAVADMASAGLNPALMYGNGAAASTPTGSNAQGSASVSPVDFQSTIAAYTQLQLARAEIKVKESEALLNTKNANKVDTEVENLRVGIEGSKLDNKQKEVVLQYLDRQEAAKTRLAEMTPETESLRQRELEQTIDKMDYEKLKIFSEYLENLEEIETLKHSQKVSDAQAYQLYHLASLQDANARYLGIQADNYDLTQGVKIKLDIGFGPFKAGSEQYLTLPQLREYLAAKMKAEQDKKEGKENNAGLDYHDYRVD